jgi:Dyp-type peroxidase family
MPPSVKVLGAESGLAMKNANGDGVEHFGYVDGRSQPLMLVEDVEWERAHTDGTSVWDPTRPLRQALVSCPGGSANSFGSYFVFRKLEQDVKGFKDAEDRLAKDLGLKGDDKERTGALVVGRFEDGTPVVLQKSDGMHHPVPNNFNYKDDPDGQKCPFHAHIRKTNPRGESVGSFAATEEEERSHLIVRRGITYGKRKKDMSDKPSKDVGLLFMCFQSSIENQFEFMQKFWANNADFVKPGEGIDPMIGQGSGPTQSWPPQWGEADKKKISFEGFVTMKGGEYFFAPCISFLKSL